VVGVRLDPGAVELERGMVAAGVVDDEVEDHADAGVVTAVDERLELGAGTEVLGRLEEVGDVVAVVGRAGDDRRQPEAVDAEGLDVGDASL